jgi:hypothetical protein
MQELSKEDLSKAEASGFPIVAIILLVVFGSLAAAALPLALGFVSVIVTGALIYFISLEMETSVFVTNMASMIGIGVAIDYSLFILARYREERAAGHSEEDARAEALSTSGLAVTFSGLAVIVSLAGLWMVDNQALRSMALGAMTVVAVSILAATTLLPALIAMLGDRVLPGGIVARVLRFVKHTLLRRGGEPAAAPAAAGTDAGSPFWERWTRTIMARPWTAVIAVSGVLLFLAIPVLSLTTGTQALEQFPKGSDVRVGNQLASEQLGGGTDPVQIVAAFDSAAAGRDPRRQRCGSSRLCRCQRADPGDPACGQRVRRGDGAGRAAARLSRALDPPRRGRDGRRWRRDRPQPRRAGADQRLDVEDRPLRAGAELPRPDGDVAFAAVAAEGRADEPALDRRRIRRAGRRLPVGLARQPARLRKPGGTGHHQCALDLRCRLRPLDGL